MKIKKSKIYFAKVKKNATIPSKNEENAGYDFYANFEEESVIIHSNCIIIIPTGIASAFHKDYVLIIKERGSTGSLGKSVRTGVIDSGYRGEIFIGINNTNNKPIIITKDKNFNNKDFIVHDYNKAIAQGILFHIPRMKTQEVTFREISHAFSNRADSKLGASGK